MDVRRNMIPGTSVYNGLLTIRIALNRHIPNFIQYGNYSVMFRYPGKPRTCRKCDGPGHEAAGCQKYKCFNCGESGHSRSVCPEPPLCGLCRQAGHSLKNCVDFWEIDHSWQSDGDEEIADETQTAPNTDNSEAQVTSDTPESAPELLIDESEVPELQIDERDIPAPAGPSYKLPRASGLPIPVPRSSRKPGLSTARNVSDGHDSDDSCLSTASKRAREDSDDTVKSTNRRRRKNKKQT